MRRAAPAALLLAVTGLVMASQAGAARLDLGDWPFGGRELSFSVPSTLRYGDVILQLTPAAAPAVGSTVQNPEAPLPTPRPLLDGQPVGPAQLTSNGTLRFRLPALAPGSHTLRLRPASELPTQSVCVADEATFPLTAAALDFTTTMTRPALLRDLRGTFFQARAGLPTVINMDLGLGGGGETEHEDADNVGAALAVVQVISGTRRVLWQDARNAPLPADFMVRLRREAELPVSARLELTGTVLRVTYRDAAGLQLALAQLTPSRLGQLAHARVNLDTPLPAVQASLTPPSTLSDYGVSDYRVLNLDQVEQPLRIAPYWQVTAPASGELVIVLSPGVAGGRVWARMDKRTSAVPVASSDGTLRLAFAGEQLSLGGPVGLVVGVQRLAVSSPSAPPPSAQLPPAQPLAPFPGMFPGQILDQTPDPTPGGCASAIQIDASESPLGFGLRPRTGLAGLPGALLASPTLRLPGTPQAITLALNVAASLPAWGLRGPLAWQVDLAGGRTPVTLTLGTGPVASDQAALTRPPAYFMARTTLRGQARYSLGAATAPALLRLAYDWSGVPAQLGDGWTSAAVEPGGQVTAAGTLQTGGAPREWWSLALSALGLGAAAVWAALTRFRPGGP